MPPSTSMLSDRPHSLIARPHSRRRTCDQSCALACGDQDTRHGLVATPPRVLCDRVVDGLAIVRTVRSEPPRGLFEFPSVKRGPQSSRDLTSLLLPRGWARRSSLLHPKSAASSSLRTSTTPTHRIHPTACGRSCDVPACRNGGARSRERLRRKWDGLDLRTCSTTYYAGGLIVCD
jgi:hypothetical protein